MLKKRLIILEIIIIFIAIVFFYFKIEIKQKDLLKIETKAGNNFSTGLIENDIEVIEVAINKESEELETLENEESVSDTPSTPINIAYDGLTMDELAEKLEHSMKNELSGKGYLYASYSIEKGVDPYLALAISLEETGCNWNCSNLVKSCNNVGGMKGSGCGSYGSWPTLDDGIRAFIDNIARNYVAVGLTTADTMNPKYAENPAWSTNVNKYINIIKNN